MYLGVFDRVILVRTKIAKRFVEKHLSDHGSNKRHSHFIGTLQEASKLLEPLITHLSLVSDHVKIQDRFAGLTVEERDSLDELIGEVKGKQPPKVDPILIEQDHDLANKFFLGIEISTKFEDVKLAMKEKTLAAPLKEYQTAFVKAAMDFQKLESAKQQFSAQNEKIVSIYQDLSKIIESHQRVALKDI
ncbi:hypothetical protein P3342_002882 [Pyrenophora teres f. teres]|uniref:DUF6604 domain-containing protein n=1 Tax=Pyrenophora teres f. teres TaxID=97479 RepID=A0A6S6V973_9PLEO|nr:hypothetical protein PTNB85_01181 [Pyrenophora teres f. teres]KAE8851202.1 hypothetical protein HRS9122_01489 [Pyrenophora teres f. teres]KAE8869875.1 hypothetical protein PTNB29_00219 [Pyrenophora teres f. teres]KAK1915076.1 hypothetical protein P3342_002882 [Pyrenophora teres f. teres]CAE7008604.1 hypothetical protein PTTW11_01718 [Pyrenophora teres f. teres]